MIDSPVTVGDGKSDGSTTIIVISFPLGPTSTTIGTLSLKTSSPSTIIAFSSYSLAAAHAHRAVALTQMNPFALRMPNTFGSKTILC